MNDNKNNPIPDPREPENRDENGAEVHNRTGSTDHNDYKITGNDGTNTSRDEKESYVDYNGNSEANNPARAK